MFFFYNKSVGTLFRLIFSAKRTDQSERMMTCLELLGRDDNELLGLELALQESNKAAVNDRGLAPEVEVKGGD